VWWFMCACCLLIMFFFFFQAEDGIRDGHVTGVQTCALPIFCRARRLLPQMARQSFGLPPSYGGPFVGVIASRDRFVRQMPGRLRSEERRVGKEWRSRWEGDDARKESRITPGG